jgi:hypothetical protein
LLVFGKIVGIFVGIQPLEENDTNMPLKDVTVRNAKATSRPRKLSDGGGLHLLISLKAHLKSKVIGQIAEKDRARLLENEYRTFPRSGLSAEQWIRARRMNLLFLGLLALVLAVVLLTTIYLVQETTRVTQTSETNWQMNLYLRGVEFLDSSGTSVAEKLCDDESRAKPTINDPISLPHGMTFETMLAVDLIIDNVFRTHQDLIYPVGLSTTWDRSIFTVYDGLDVQRYRSKLGSKFQRTLLKTVTLTLPEKTGLQYIIIMSGAMMNTQQLFYATGTSATTASPDRYVEVYCLIRFLIAMATLSGPHFPSSRFR